MARMSIDDRARRAAAIAGLSGAAATELEAAIAKELREALAQQSGVVSRGLDSQGRAARPPEGVEPRQAALALTTDWTYVTEPSDDGSERVVWASESFRERTGYDPATLNAEGGWCSLLHPEDAEVIEGRRVRVFDGEVSVLDYRIVTRDGSEMWIRDRVRPERRDAEGRVTRVVGAVKDVTEVYATNGQPAPATEGGEGLEGAALFEACLSASTDALVATDQLGRIIAINELAQELTGWPREEALGRALGDVLYVVDEQSREVVEDPAERVLRSGRPVGLTNHAALVSRGGEERPIAELGVPVRTTEGEVIGALVVFRDQTSERANLQALRVAERSFRTLVERAPFPITINRDGKFVYVNRAAGELLGREPAELVGRDVLEVVHPEEHDEVRRRRLEVAGSGAEGVPLVERRLVRKDGSPVLIEVAGHEIIFDRAPAMLSVIRDLSERRRFEAQLMLNERMASLGTIATSVAHQLNNPLAYLVANLDVVIEELHAAGPDAAGLAQAVAEARDGAGRIREIVDDLEVFGVPEQDQPVHPVQVVPLLSWAERMAGNTIKHRARLVRDYQEVPPAIATEGRLGMVFLNLLLHAFKAVPRGRVEDNEVVLAVGASDEDEEQMAGVRVLIEHSGAEISHEAAAALLDPAGQRTADRGDTHLLSVAASLVSDLGGEMSAEPRPGGGVRFNVLLPAGRHRVKPRTTPPEALKRPRDGARILVVDDEPLVLLSMRRALSGHVVSEATGARQALERLREEEFDLILCDIMMPELTGVDLYQEIKRTRPGMEGRMVFMSGGVFSDTERNFLREVNNPRLRKPFGVDELRAVVAERLSR